MPEKPKKKNLGSVVSKVKYSQYVRAQTMNALESLTTPKILSFDEWKKSHKKVARPK